MSKLPKSFEALDAMAKDSITSYRTELGLLETIMESEAELAITVGGTDVHLPEELIVQALSLLAAKRRESIETLTMYLEGK